MFERRTLERIEMGRLALVHVDGVRGCHPCHALNIHTHGAMLCSCTYHTAAFRFDLSLDGFKTTKHCHVIWRNGNTCGVEFVNRV